MSRVYRYSIITSVALFAVMYAVVAGFTGPLVSLFNSEGVVELAGYAYTGMRIYFIGFLFAGFNIISAGYFSAVEMAKESFVVSVLRGFVLMVVISVILSRLFGMNGVWSSFPAAESITTCVCVLFIILNNTRVKRSKTI